jgi:HAE1 family hydrophobic/amphiphilic exporter-1
MKLVEFSIQRRVTVSMIAIALVLFGGVAFTRLPINLLPDLSYPTITVETRLPGAAPTEVEALVTRPVEELVGVVAGVTRLTSVSRPGLSQVTAEFGWGQNMDFAALDVRQKLDLASLPREAERPVLLRFDPANDPIVRLFLTGKEGETPDLYQLRYAAEEVLEKDLESTAGVAAIKVNGGFEEEIEVRLDEGKLALLGLELAEVSARLLRENVNQAGGSLYEAEARYLVRARNEFRNLDDIRNTILLSREGRNVLLGDVAEVSRGHRQREVVTRYAGQEAVELAIYKEGDANTVQVARAVRERLQRIEKELPAGVEVVVGTDQSRFIEASIDEVLSNAWIGGLIAIGVLLLFLKDAASTLVIGISIPISIIATFFLMYRTGTTLNIMSLGGLALGVGMLVDNAIVVLEAIFARREKGEEPLSAARKGASEVGMAVVASTLTTVAVFLPVVFLEGVAAQLFRDQALTVSFSLMASLVVSLTLIPMLSALTARRREAAGAAATVTAPAGRLRRALRFVLVGVPAFVVGGLRRVFGLLGRGLAWVFRPLSRLFDAALDRMLAAYPGTLRWALGNRAAVLGVVGLAAGFCLWLVPRMGFDLIPSFTQGEFAFEVELPEGTPLAATDAFVASAAQAVAGDARIASLSSTSGGAGLSLSQTGTEGENSARIAVRMASGTSKRDEAAVIDALRERLAANGQARVELVRPTYFSFRTPIEVELYGDRVEDLIAGAQVVKARMSEIPGLVDVATGAELGNPEVQVSFDREALMRLGLDLSTVAATVRGKLQGDVATRFLEGDREIEVRVRSVAVGEARVQDVRSLIVAQKDGVPIPLAAVASIEVAQGPSEIRRLGQKRAAVVSGDLAGRDMASVAAEVRAALRELPLPGGVTAQLSGQEEELARSQRSLLLALGLAVFLVYLVMASQFESLLHPFVILFTLPLGGIGAIGALAATGRSIDLVAAIGMVMLAGIVVNNAIVLIDCINQLRAAGMRRVEAMIEAGRTRLRPILMTTSTTVLGLAPMALGLGEGAELRAPLAITVIGGLTMATVLTLVVIPIVYSLLDRRPDPVGQEVPVDGAAAGQTPVVADQALSFGTSSPHTA